MKKYHIKEYHRFEEPNKPTKDQILKDSPTCSKENLGVVLSVIVQKKWKLISIDIKTAFFSWRKH